LGSIAPVSNARAAANSRANGALVTPATRVKLNQMGSPSPAIRSSIASTDATRAIAGDHNTIPRPPRSPVVPLRQGVAQAGTRAQSPCKRRAANFQTTRRRVSELIRQGAGFDFDHIYRKYSPRVFTLCLRMVKNQTEAEDLTQEVFIQLFRKLDSYRGESAFATWLYRVAVNVVLMRLRRKSLITSSLDEVTEIGEGMFALHQVLGAPDRALSGTVDRVVLERAIRELAPRFRMVLLLHDLEGYAHSEIAAMLGVRTGTSKSQLHKARCRLRLLLRITR